MSTNHLIRGMAWDHPRGRDPLEAISAHWSTGRGVEVSWDARPLKDFEDQPLEELATAYDLVLIDHPFTGTAADSGLVTPVDDWVEPAYLADQAAHSAGPSYSSYTWNGKQWALAIDAACQVSAVRDDLLGGLCGAAPPADWAGVISLADSLPEGGPRVAIPLNPNHAYCAFLSVGIGFTGPAFWPRDGHVDRAAGAEALEFLRRLADRLHPLSKSFDPIGISDRMSTGNDIAYVPLMFGYSSYARQGFRTHRLRFADAPRGESNHIGSVLGGVGLALSAQSPNPEAAADLARAIASPAVQSGLYFESGGQPGHAAAWESPSVNAAVGDFFRATRRTIDQAFMRPRVPGHRQFQVAAGELVHRCIWLQEMGTGACLDEFDALAGKLLWTGDA